MIHFYYSSSGQYSVTEIYDIKNSFIVDKSRYKIMLFGSEDFYFQKNSDIYSMNLEDEHLGLSQKGAYDMYIDVSDIIKDVSIYTHTNINSINTSINLLDSSLDVLSVKVADNYNTIVDLSTYSYKEDKRLDTSIIDLTEQLKIDEEVWALALVQLNSSIIDISTYSHSDGERFNEFITDLSTNFYKSISYVDESILDLSTYSHDNITNLNISINELSIKSNLNDEKLDKSILDVSVYAHTNIELIDSSLYDVSLYSHKEDKRLDTSIIDLTEQLKIDEEVWAAALNVLNSSIGILFERLSALE